VKERKKELYSPEEGRKACLYSPRLTHLCLHHILIYLWRYATRFSLASPVYNLPPGRLPSLQISCSLLYSHHHDGGGALSISASTYGTLSYSHLGKVSDLLLLGGHVSWVDMPCAVKACRAASGISFFAAHALTSAKNMRYGRCSSLQIGGIDRIISLLMEVAEDCRA